MESVHEDVKQEEEAEVECSDCEQCEGVEEGETEVMRKGERVDTSSKEKKRSKINMADTSHTSNRQPTATHIHNHQQTLPQNHLIKNITQTHYMTYKVKKPYSVQNLPVKVQTHYTHRKKGKKHQLIGGVQEEF